ncbi:MAG: alanine dehydrogenase [Coriobacteriia bacterium]
MIVGIPREIKDDEYRVGMTPGGVRELVERGHRVLVEKSAGVGSAIEDEQYERAGAVVVSAREDVWGQADLIVKVKEPQPEETALLREGQVLFAFLHLAPDDALTRALVDSGSISIAYETVRMPDGSLPLLAPMSEIAGRMAAQVGAAHLQITHGGRGVLMGGVPGVLPAKVAVLGGGVVGINAAFVASGMGAEVTIVDIDIERLRYLEEIWTGRFWTLFSNRQNVEEVVFEADLVIGAVLVPGARAPQLVTRDMLPRMKRRSVIVDVAVDQGGCVETIHPTTHHDPVYEVDGVLHYGVTNIPGAVPATSTSALTNATTKYVVALAEKGWERAILEDAALASGVNVACGAVTCQPVAEAHGLVATPVEELLR